MTSQQPTNAEVVSRRDGERGAAGPATVVILMPVMVMLLWFAVFTGRMVNIHQEVTSAARDASRQAAVHGTPGAARLAAEADVKATLTSAGVACQNLGISVDVGSFGPGALVEVTVSCEVSLADVTSVWAPGTKTFTGTSTAVVDTFRGGNE